MARSRRGASPSGERDPGETREMILRTAQQLFMERGYRAVSTRQIADACGLTQPALYHYFADKQALYVEMMRAWTVQTRAVMERIARRGEGVEERLRAVARYIVQHTHTEAGMGIMLHDIQHELDAPAQQVMRELFETTYLAPIASIFADGVRQGAIRTPASGGVVPQAAAYLFLGLVSLYLPTPHGAPREPLRSGGQGTDGERAEEAVRVLLHGLGER